LKPRPHISFIYLFYFNSERHMLLLLCFYLFIYFNEKHVIHLGRINVEHFSVNQKIEVLVF
jgi:hypothetical protein